MGMLALLNNDCIRLFAAVLCTQAIWNTGSMPVPRSEFWLMLL